MQLTQSTLTQSQTPSVDLNQAPSTITPFSNSTFLLTESQSRTLQAARQTLLTADKPHLLKVVSYLRISCSVLRSYRQGLLFNSALPTKITFSGLMQSLYDYDPEWWKHCQVTIAGRLTSTDAVIAHLLQPIDAFHQL